VTFQTLYTAEVDRMHAMKKRNLSMHGTMFGHSAFYTFITGVSFVSIFPNHDLTTHTIHQISSF